MRCLVSPVTVAALVLACAPVHASVIAHVGTTAWYLQNQSNCQKDVNGLPGQPVYIACRSEENGAVANARAYGNIYHGHVEVHVNHDSIGSWFVGGDATLDFTDTLTILGGTGEGELWGGGSTTDNWPCCSYFTIDSIRFPGPVHFTFGVPLTMGYSLFSTAGSDSPSNSSNDAYCCYFQVFDSTGAEVKARFYSGEYGLLSFPGQGPPVPTPEPSPGVLAACVSLALCARVARVTRRKT